MQDGEREPPNAAKMSHVDFQAVQKLLASHWLGCKSQN